MPVTRFKSLERSSHIPTVEPCSPSVRPYAGTLERLFSGGNGIHDAIYVYPPQFAGLSRRILGIL
ncbi:hypothetical protein BD309DRAFT_952099, partial [Dichomitus squalens]